MKRTIAALIVTTFAAAACTRPATVQSGGEVVGTVQPSNANMIPTGTDLEVRLNQTLGTSSSKVGDQFTATVANPLTATNGQVVVPSGSVVYGQVTGLHASEHAGDQAAIKLNFDSLSVNGRNYPFDADVKATNLQTTGGDTQNETLQKAGIGAAAGAVLGAVLGKDLKGAVIGGLLGAAAGTAISLGTGEVQAQLPAGTTMRLQTTQQVALNNY